MPPHSSFALRRLLLFLLLFSCCILAWSHTVNLAMERAPLHQVMWFYFKLGVQHIIPEGFDHILFIIALCLLNIRLRTILWQATAFTVAHCITLALSAKGVINLPSSVVEPIIAASIAFVAIENLLIDQLKLWRVLIVFCFGLIHGMGFAAALNQIGLPRNSFFKSILSFNIGVEVGQIIVILTVFGLIIYPFGKKPWYKKGIVYPLSMVIALVALYWTVQRVLH